MVNHSNLCMNCFSKISSGTSTCPVCGWDTHRDQVKEALPYQAEIGGRYVIGRVKSMNGEGITYAAYDAEGKCSVELREFFPLSIAERNEQDNWIIPMAGYDSLFDHYLNEFIDLAKNISRLKKVTVIHTVTDIVEQNQTAYVCYAFVPTISLSRYVKKNGVLTWNNVNNMFSPVLTAMGLVNSLGVSHLGLSPETIRVTAEGNLLVTLFCLRDVRRVGTPLLEELYDGCAAIEQYTPDAETGETSDVYAVAACMIYAISGSLPGGALQRMKDGRLLIAREYLKDLPPNVVTALANALQVRKDDRTAGFETFRTSMSSAPKIVSQEGNANAIRTLPAVEEETKNGLSPMMWLVIAGLATLVVLAVIVTAWLKGRSETDGLQNGGAAVGTEQSVDERAVPDILNLDYAELQKQIDEGKLNYTLRVSSKEFSDTVAEGAVISQDPMASEEMKGDRVITITVSKGSALRTLPEIAGVSYEALYATLDKNGFVVERVDEPSEDVVAGAVVGYRDHQEGDSLEYASVVVVVVSSGTQGAEAETTDTDPGDQGADEDGLPEA